jgi:hypothetical protein
MKLELTNVRSPRGVDAASTSSRSTPRRGVNPWRTSQRPEGRAPAGQSAFSLLEVMIAIALFFGAAFAILSVVSGGLANARALQRPQVDAAAVASIYSTTNKIVETTDSGDLGDLLGDSYHGYTWESSSVEVQSNKLFLVNFTIYSPAPGHPVFSQISTLFFRPLSPPGSLDSGLGFH